MDDTLTAHLKLAEYYNVPVPPYPMPKMQKWEVDTFSLNVRDSPGGKWIGYIHDGAIVTIIDELAGWAEIAPGQWVSSRYLRKVE